ncbi:MAG: thiosulfohydrolase SoxB [Alphaproteobacteria bacterium]|nr:thiosulfohydrolase SoxB [Alphaproteobacteria bacterium]
MLTRRDFAQWAMAAAALGGAPAALAQTRPPSFDSLIEFRPLGQVTLLHFADCHAQLLPIYFREPSVNLGVGESKGLPPHITGDAFLAAHRLTAGSAEAYALADRDFARLARAFGPIGGMDRMASAVKAIRAARPANTLLLDGGDTWQGSYTSLASKGEDMVEVMNLLGVDAMTGHWEFTYGEKRVEALIAKLKFPFLVQNVRETEFDEPVFKPYALFERGGVRLAVIGQGFPYTPIANPRHLIPKWSFGIREKELAATVAQARGEGAELVVLLSHNGFDVDRKLAARVPGIDVILTGHTHDALPVAVEVGRSLLIASGSHGKFLSRLDLEVRDKRIAAYRYRLIPLFADTVPSDDAMSDLIRRVRGPHERHLATPIGMTESLLYRRGNFNGSFDDVICRAMLEQREAEIALSPGFRWGNSLLPGQAVTAEDVYNQTAITYPNCYRREMTGAQLKEILEDVADNLFNPDPYYQQGGDMVRTGGLGFVVDVGRPMGSRISDLTLLRTGQPLEAAKSYVVAGWASIAEDTQGPPIWDVVQRHILRAKTIRQDENASIKVRGI